MLRVLSHYLPLRTALLVLSESLLLLLVIGAGMTEHLWGNVPRQGQLVQELARLSLNVNQAILRCIFSATLLTALCQVAVGFNQLYDFRVSSSRYERAARFVESTGTALAIALGLMVAAELWGLERLLDFPGLRFSQRAQTVVVTIVAGFGVLYLWRHAYHWGMRRLDLNQRVLVLGSHGPAHSLARAILERPEAGYEIAGMVGEPAPRPGEPVEPSAELPAELDRPRRLLSPDHAQTPQTRRLVLEDFRLSARADGNQGVAMSPAAGPPEPGSLLELVRRLRVDTVVVAFEDRRRTLPTQELLRCRLAGIEVREREELYEEITGKLAVEAMRPSYLIFNEGFRRHPWAELLKRSFDIACALLILALTWPLMVLTALLVRIDSPGPILFKQERVGQDGRPFTLMKFRSMRQDAEKETGPVWSRAGDPRITPWGRVMRKTRLDELPQLFNVLKGEMSLVGPRPERAHFVDELASLLPYYHQRHVVKPGLTGWAQINYPYGSTVEDALHKLQYDLFYIKNQSLLFDLSILFNTIKTVVLRQGT